MIHSVDIYIYTCVGYKSSLLAQCKLFLCRFFLCDLSRWVGHRRVHPGTWLRSTSGTILLLICMIRFGCVIQGSGPWSVLFPAFLVFSGWLCFVPTNLWDIYVEEESVYSHVKPVLIYMVKQVLSSLFFYVDFVVFACTILYVGALIWLT